METSAEYRAYQAPSQAMDPEDESSLGECHMSLTRQLIEDSKDTADLGESGPCFDPNDPGDENDAPEAETDDLDEAFEQATIEDASALIQAVQDALDPTPGTRESIELAALRNGACYARLREGSGKALLVLDAVPEDMDEIKAAVDRVRPAGTVIYFWNLGTKVITTERVLEPRTWWDRFLAFFGCIQIETSKWWP